ncbi:hypothetical protein M406DRAFT_257216 [Cryphonectria parasitica EP155]|uniref:HSF-type DNA-binding domain-containing protein n=1 Tax=Cryphonectria parasitica (strain ATCC 38755 / EP155) TaxID=660469 RepID=A0A9P5CNH6_CRYP1|nr:uncharacterized protein M406DRAFT_257216 [Cryphonectria parasitica EP155]KAF3765469.1 hypothetical protein M406DRAFT_257216 [Cryphonectria parasitica EP155]
MSSPNSRKRAAPGANPLPTGPIQQAPQQYTTQDPMMHWNGMAANGNNFADVSNQYMSVQPQIQPQIQPQVLPHAQSNAVALRDNSSRALVSTAPHPVFDAQPEQWSNTETALIPATNARPLEDDPEQQLRDALARARKIEEEAKKEGSNQKRAIPPFVQKLASFLDNGKNSDLIRWSEKGDSFIVLDEDEFAKKLIPEMFKHNNYASFVRQLNMYGFHKKVGLSDNSMRASEKKNKSPSEYAHQYFRRGYDILQWLIQKPNKGSGKRKQAKNRDMPDVMEADSDDDFMDDGTQTYAVSGAPNKSSSYGRNESGPLAKPAEMGKFREQLAEVQQKQQQVLAMIHNLRQNQDQIMQKAMRVEQMHQRHENSITAILNFLANVFRKSLEGKGSAEHLSEMLASILPLSGQNGVATGTVQDLGDLGEYLQQQAVPRTSMSPVPQKRQQHLLPGIPAKSPSATVGPPSPSPINETPAPSYEAPQSSRVTEVYDASPSDTTSPAYYRNELQSNPQEAMMKIMGATNAQMTPDVNLAEVAAATSASMPSDQRNRMLNSMSQRTVSPGTNRPPSAYHPPTTQAAIPNAAAIPSPWLNVDNNNTNANFDLNDLNHHGTFEGGDPTNFDFSVTGAGAHDFIHGQQTTGDTSHLVDGLHPTTEAQDTPSPAVTEEIQRSDLDGLDVPAAKRRRQA